MYVRIYILVVFNKDRDIERDLTQFDQIRSESDDIGLEGIDHNINISLYSCSNKNKRRWKVKAAAANCTQFQVLHPSNMELILNVVQNFRFDLPWISEPFFRGC